MKGQAEIIGLVLIVILISIGFLLYVKFSLAPNDDVQSSFQESQLTQTFLNSMQKVSVQCGDRQFVMKDLLGRIAVGQSTPGCAAEDAVHQKFSTALDESLRKWGINYRLRFQRLPRNGDPEALDAANLPDLVNVDIPERLRCSEEMNRMADRVLIPIGVTQTNIVLLLERCQ